MAAEVLHDRDDINTNLPVAEASPAARLATSLFHLDIISQKMQERRDLRRRNEQIVKDAIEYRSPFEQEMIAALVETRGLLFERGIISQDTEKMEKLQVRTERELEVESNGQRDTAAIKGILREISHTVHSDTADSVASHIFPKEEKPEIIGMVIRAKDIGSLEMAEEVYLETMPKFYFEEVKSFLRDGLSFEQIIKLHPDLLPKIDKVREAALKKLNEPFPKGLSSIMERAEELRREADFKARLNGVGMIYFYLSGLTEYLKPQKRRLSIKLDSLVDSMKGTMHNVARADVHLAKSKKNPAERNYEKVREENAIRKLVEIFQKLVGLVLSEKNSEEDIEQQISRFDDAVSAVTQRGIDYDRALAS
ncbi:MAG: hypothetical protein HYT08_03010 [Candidatus Levybacteria bacterium]|nr:hypothetical protein [Candidatus Levybacteria bacterium]